MEADGRMRSDWRALPPLALFPHVHFSWIAWIGVFDANAVYRARKRRSATTRLGESNHGINALATSIDRSAMGRAFGPPNGTPI